MSETVHILASCRNLELLPATLMVFRTLRVGFPSADVFVHINNMHPFARQAVEEAAKAARCEVVPYAPGVSFIHDAWVERIFEHSDEPFWICDTDVAFFGSCEDWNLEGNFAGRFIPRFDEEWTRTIHEERLHTCLQWFDPQKSKQALWAWSTALPDSWMSPQLSFIKQAYWPQKGGRTLFHDTTAGLWHTIGGTRFTDEQNSRFEHLNCGTYSDLIGPHLKDAEHFSEAQAALAANPQAAAGIQKQQAEYYRKRA